MQRLFLFSNKAYRKDHFRFHGQLVSQRAAVRWHSVNAKFLHPQDRLRSTNLLLGAFRTRLAARLNLLVFWALCQSFHQYQHCMIPS